MDRLINTVQHYAWGSVDALPALLGTPPTGRPQAELWMGAHPSAPSRLDRGHGSAGTPSLLDVIEADPVAQLGEATLRRHGVRLPFLLKLLAAAEPLSLQVHPDRTQAAAGYAREEAAGIPLTAPHRCYKDDQHKPELIVALTAFRGLCGFRDPRESANLLEEPGVAALDAHIAALRKAPEEEALHDCVAAFLDAPPHTLEAVARSLARLASGPGPRAGTWSAYAGIARRHPGDPGLLVALLLHLVTLSPGEGLYLGPGVPHAYLEGLGVEIMASSDNVLRCGLTAKHIDVPELLRVVRFSSTAPHVLGPEAGPGGEEVYDTPADDFRLSRWVLPPGGPERRFDAAAPQILLCTRGSALVRTASGELPLPQGASAYLPAGEAGAVHGTGTVFRATVNL
ncbi:mannose-6-phosphate isomerase, class I [Streptomyces griseosporeus]|uniref:mannose-6-phosphate isomerase, class I n=1 Tax=Streptomyces griseosporeus TaxID=1910 RepID=UPI00167D69CE|nr:mannose-6-phosphate isomerase, class I [Streptomyces griseosporeus]GHF39073.1 mannose-6-phosphate isomerase, class I [Streptomyces griseosporeus]